MLNNFSKTNHPVSNGTRTLPNSNPILFPLDLDLNFAIRPQENYEDRGVPVDSGCASAHPGKTGKSGQSRRERGKHESWAVGKK